MKPVDATLELVETYSELERNYAPFVEDGQAWKGDVDGLEAILRHRDESLARGGTLMARIRAIWPVWEAASPGNEERAKVFAARNRLVELGLSVSKADSILQGKVRRRAEDLRKAAAESGRTRTATIAYRQGRAGF